VAVFALYDNPDFETSDPDYHFKLHGLTSLHSAGLPLPPLSFGSILEYHGIYHMSIPFFKYFSAFFRPSFFG
jgi:hypothetical protein